MPTCSQGESFSWQLSRATSQLALLEPAMHWLLTDVGAISLALAVHF